MTDKTLRTLEGRTSWLSREFLQEKLDATLIQPPMDADAMVIERIMATRENRLTDFYTRLHLSRFSAEYQPGDEVWEYSDLQAMSGSAGYALIRKDQVVKVVQTMMA